MSHRIIGLLGGSFNPAHEGHIHISLEAIRRLGLDEVWWLVSPHNPLKNANTLEDYAERLATASQLAAAYPRIRVSDAEARLGTRYTIDTLRALKRKSRGARFIWIMGADNLAQFHRWRKWADIMWEIPVAVMDRAPHSQPSLKGKAAIRFMHFRVSGGALKQAKRLPAWAFLHLRRDPRSATAIRKHLESRG